MNATVEQSRLVAFRVWAGIRGSSGPTQEVCATRPRVSETEITQHVRVTQIQINLRQLMCFDVNRNIPVVRIIPEYFEVISVVN